MDKCDICNERKPCGKIVAYRRVVESWQQTSEVIVCVDCADIAGKIEAASIKSWAGRKAKV